MDPTIEQCNEAFGAAPRKFSLKDRWGYLRIPYPDWVRQNKQDPILALWGGMPRLMREGIVTWGHVVQANSMLFEPGPENHPGELVYCIKENREFNPNDLQEIAGRIYDLKGTKPDSEKLLPIADYLTDERIRVFGLDIPAEISPDLPCQVSTTMFVRKHLPGGKLQRSLMPIVVLPDSPQIALPLPSRFWPEQFLEWWNE